MHYSGNYTKAINTLCANASHFNVEAGGTYSNRCALKKCSEVPFQIIFKASVLASSSSEGV
jgi:hypothetical protein